MVGIVIFSKAILRHSALQEAGKSKYIIVSKAETGHLRRLTYLVCFNRIRSPPHVKIRTSQWFALDFYWEELQVRC